MMQSLAEIKKQYTKDAKFYAVGDNGKKYKACYSAELKIMFFAIPSTVKILGYVER